MVYPIVNTGKSLKIGMFSRSSHSIVDIDKCLLCNNIINSVYSVSKEYFESSSKFKGYDFKKKIGDLKYLVIRVGNDKILVTIVAKKGVNLNDYWNVLNTNFNNIGLSLIISDSDDEIISGKYVHLFGLESLDLEEFGIKYSINNLGFMQVNDKIKFELYNRVLDEVNCQDTVIDCYSGAGLLSAIISKKCNKVIGIEINKSASNSAKNLAKTNNLNNIQFINGDVKDNIREVLNSNPSSIIVLDPPRSGCERLILEYINEKNVRKIIYISCNPATLARDISILKEKFEVSKVIPWDMFPQTKHVETLVILERVVF
jgi:23S rRNA (uracil1939-C5)-methyltransferase